MCKSLLLAWMVVSSVGNEDQADVKESVKLAWESLSGFEADVEEGILDKPGLVPMRLSIKYRADRDWDVRVNGHSSEGKTFSKRFMQDGKRVYESDFDGQEKMVFLLTRALSDDPKDYMCFPSIITMVLLPGGRSIVSNLAQASKVNAGRNGQNQRTVELTVPFHGGLLRCELDGEHDWWPSSVTIGNGAVVYRVTKFGRDNGRWFPLEGEQVRATPAAGEAPKRSFRVTSVRINRPVSTTSFAKIIPDEGTVIEDTVSRKTYMFSKKKNKINDPGRRPPADSVANDSIVAGPPKSYSLLWFVVGIGSGCLLVSVLIRHIRGR